MSMDVQRMKDELLLRGIDPSKPAFVYPSAGRRPEELNVSRNVNAPLQAARGWAAGLLGLPGDVEGLLRQGVNFAFGPGGVNVSPTPALPTSDFYREYLPGYDPQPFARAVSGAGALTGGMGATGVARGAMKAGQAAGQALGPTAAGMAETYLLKSGLAPSVVKPKGGNWLSGSVERATQPLKRGVVDEAAVRRLMGDEFADERLADPIDNAVNNWIDTKLNKYIRNEMATPEDPVRKLAERGVLHVDPEILGVNRWRAPQKRTMAGGEQLGRSEAAKIWEDSTDVAINTPRAGEMAYPSVLEKNPWLAKLDPEQRVYALNAAISHQPEVNGLGFDHLIDELRNATRADSDLPANLRWKPEDLKKVTMEQAVERVAKINDWRAAQMAAAQKAAREGIPIHKEYEGGFQWMAAPDTAIDPKSLQYIRDVGCESGWCTQGEDLARQYGGRGNQLYVLHEPSGKPVVQISVKPGKQWNERSGVFHNNPELEDSWRQFSIESHFGAKDKRPNDYITLYPEWLSKNQPELYQKYERVFQTDPPEIVQIKGRQNRPPKEEHLPMVQDFVRSGNWSRVGDLQNTGMRATKDVFNESELRKLQEAGAGNIPFILSGEEIQRLHNMIVPEGKRLKYDASGRVIGHEGGPGYAKGGRVPTMNEMRQAILKPMAYAKGGRVPTMDQMRLALMDKKSMKDSGAVDNDYRGEHRAPGPNSGKPMHDLKDVYPDDFYGPNGFRYYADTGAEYDRPSYVTARMAKGKPDQKVWIHRAIPTDVYKKALSTQAPLQQMIRPGDWVTISKQYAREHGEANLKGDYKIASKQVPASHLYTNGDSINEWGYHPTSRMDKE